MAVIRIKEKEIELKDGSPIQEACEELGVLFGCKEGRCGTCRIEIVEGAENLSELTDNEKMMDATLTVRYACQCTIKKGIVTIKQY